MNLVQLVYLFLFETLKLTNFSLDAQPSDHILSGEILTYINILSGTASFSIDLSSIQSTRVKEPSEYFYTHKI